jgi:hypothetical protein
MGYVRGPLAERFWDKVKKSNGCWTWTAGQMGAGYGCLYVATMKRMLQAHRVSWMLHHGSLPPKGVGVLHRCDNRLCVRPDHLFLGTQEDNVRDCREKGRWNDRRGSKNARSVLRESDIPEIRRRAKAGTTRAQLAREYGITWAAMRDVVNGKHWRHVA